MIRKRPEPISINQTDSFEVESLSPLLSPQIKPTEQIKNLLPLRHLHSLPTQLPDLPDSPSKINKLERDLITKLAQIFVSEQCPKPGKILIRVNSTAEQGLQNNEVCRFNKVQISRFDEQQIKQVHNAMQWDSNSSVFSFKNIPQIAGVIVNNPSPNKSMQKPNVEPLVESQEVSSEISEISHLTYRRVINISYKPNNIRPYKPSFYMKNSPPSTPTAATPNFSTVNPHFSPQFGKNNFAEVDGKKQELPQYTKLATLDMFTKFNQLKNTNHEHRLRLLRKVEENFKQFEEKKNIEVAQLKEQLVKYQKQLKIKEKECKELMEKFSQLSKKLVLQTNKVNQEKKGKEKYKKAAQELYAQVKQLKKCMKEMKEQMTAKDSLIKQTRQKQLQILERNNTQNTKNLSQNEIEKISSAIFKMVSNKALPQSGATFNSNVNNILPFLLAPPQKKDLQPDSPGLLSKKSSHVSFLNRPQSPTDNPLSPRMRSFKSTEPIITQSMLGSRDSSRSHSILSNMTRKSALKGIGYIKSQSKNNSGVLQDFMEQEQVVQTPFLGQKDITRSKQEREWMRIMSKIQK